MPTPTSTTRDLAYLRRHRAAVPPRPQTPASRQQWAEWRQLVSDAADHLCESLIAEEEAAERQWEKLLRELVPYEYRKVQTRRIAALSR